MLTPGLAACGGDGGYGGDGGGNTTPTAERTTNEPSAPADPAAAEKEIRQNWEKFFDPQTPVDEKKKLLQNGELLGPVLEVFSGDNRAGQVKAQVTGIAFTSPTEADVTFTLTLKGPPPSRTPPVSPSTTTAPGRCPPSPCARSSS
ncbi:hypothetical protein SHKM778_66420 [Streptomyces sp. KM77-8]|uniref:Low molecular weight antigen MTB12-like C-terminal domain-containing protein n=1 Tax=Streptomyces haneummycinicus TaxID=3074435 RepID=A0AAT9HS89_9ACTN